jgi:hypothetical protein
LAQKIQCNSQTLHSKSVYIELDVRRGGDEIEKIPRSITGRDTGGRRHTERVVIFKDSPC